MNVASDLVERKNLLCLWKGLVFSELVSAVGAAVTEDDTPPRHLNVFFPGY